MKLDRFRWPPEPPTLSLTAMIDVLFLMIVFLVLGANFEQVATVALPAAHGDPGDGAATLSVTLRADGALLLDGAPLPPERAVAQLKALAPRAILILPDRAGRIDDLFRWVDRLQLGLNIPVRVGVQTPSP